MLIFLLLMNKPTAQSPETPPHRCDLTACCPVPLSAGETAKSRFLGAPTLPRTQRAYYSIKKKKEQRHAEKEERARRRLASRNPVPVPTECPLCSLAVPDVYLCRKKHNVRRTFEDLRKDLTRRSPPVVCLKPKKGGGPGGRYECRTCESFFTDFPSLDTHCTDEHPLSFDFPCPLCSRGFNDEKTLVDHMKVKHRYMPTQCNRVVALRSGR